MSRRASETFKLAADSLHKEHPEPLFDRLETALRAASILAAGDEYRADRAAQETMTHVPVAYPPLVGALLPVAEVLAPPETGSPV